jgi:hypothetical protein
VCESCNKALGRELDEVLATDSIEAFDRARLKIRPFRSKGARANLHAVLSAGPLRGARGRLVPHASSRGVALEPAPQIGLTPDGGERQWFSLDRLPPKDALARAGCSNVYVEVIGPLEPARRALEERGYGPLGEFQENRGAMNEADGDLVLPVTQVHLRAVAKIALGYLAAATNAGFAMLPAFNDARRFVRDGIVPPRPIVSVRPNKFVAEAQAMHYLALEARGGIVVGWVSLFMRLRYVVTLGQVALPSFVASSHVFDPENRSVRCVRREAWA